MQTAIVLSLCLTTQIFGGRFRQQSAPSACAGGPCSRPSAAAYTPTYAPTMIYYAAAIPAVASAPAVAAAPLPASAPLVCPPVKHAGGCVCPACDPSLTAEARSVGGHCQAFSSSQALIYRRVADDLKSGRIRPDQVASELSRRRDEMAGPLDKLLLNTAVRSLEDVLKDLEVAARSAEIVVNSPSTASSP